MPATIIAFEGLDCCFKETNSNALYEYLKKGFKDDRHIYIYHFPMYENESSFFVREFLQGKYPDMENEGFNALSISLAYSMDRFHIWQKEIKDIYYNDPRAIIIMDRWTMSNVFFQSARYREDDYSANNIHVREIEKAYGITPYNFPLVVEQGIMRMPTPDLTIFMNVPYQLSRDIRASKIDKDINELNENYLKKVYEQTENYIQQNKHSHKVAIIECSRYEITDSTFGLYLKSKEVILDEIIAKVNKFFVDRSV